MRNLSSQINIAFNTDGKICAAQYMEFKPYMTRGNWVGRKRAIKLPLCSKKLSLDRGTKAEQNKQRTKAGVAHMYRFARESLALASVVSFVWMVCQVVQIAG
jgi:hypothetical protein